MNWRSTMSRSFLKATMVVAVAVGGLSSVTAVGQILCDNLGASASVGACEVKFRCQQYTTEGDCDTCANVGPLGITTCWDVKEDFPTQCLTLENSNCNEPLRDCFVMVTCKWESGACIKNVEAAPWAQRKKRESVPCNLEGSDSQVTQ